MPGSKRWNEPVQLAVKRNLLENIAAIGFECSAEVVDIDSAQLGHQPVGATGWNTAKPEIIHAMFAPPADNVVTLVDFLEKNRNVSGVVLQIAIHGDDVFAAGMVETCSQGGGLSEIAPQAHHQDPAVYRGNFP